MPRIPLAWLQLSYEKLRLLAALAGISFAVILMLVQLGLSAALFDAAVLLYSHFRADLVLVSPQFDYILNTGSFPRQRLYQAHAIEGVEAANPVYLGLANWKNPVEHRTTSLLMMGFDPGSSSLALPEVEKASGRIELPDAVIYDVASHAKFGPVGDLYQQNPRLFTEINGRRVRIVGLFRLGIGFAAVGNVLTSEANFLRIFPTRTQSMIDIGLLQIKPGTDPLKVRARLVAALPEDVRVMTRDEFLESEKDHWRLVSPIGFVFGMGVFMGFVVGSVIVYQILYTDVSDHLAEYATLKAMGYGDFYLFSVVFKEGLLLSVLGYIPGLAISQGLYMLTAQRTGLPIGMTPERIAMVFIFTVVMCCGSAAFAMQRIRSADPADVF